MSLNLVLDRWIPVRRIDGTLEKVAPWHLTDQHEARPVTTLASPRADFDGALAQFLVGLLQTAYAPGDGREWTARFEEPPAPLELKSQIDPLTPYFELFGEGARFLQDLELQAPEGKEEPIERLLIESPGGNTLRQGIDHFVKGTRVNGLCPSCAAAALLTLQINAPSGGQGHRTSLRGGGPLTTLILHPGSLWRTLWLNVLEDGDLSPRSGSGRPSERFPWLAPTRTSEGGRGTAPEDVDPLQVYWSMPRRIRLTDPEPAQSGAVCSLCSGDSSVLVERYLTKNLGVNYTGAWHHPLTPYRRGKDGTPLPAHGSPAGIAYRDWLGLIQEDPDAGQEPAQVVAKYRSDERRLEVEGSRRLWAFGYDMDNMKARRWVEGSMPLLVVATEHQEAYGREIARLVLGARSVAGSLRWAVKEALSDRPKDLARAPLDVELRFWQETEGPFYEHLHRVHRAVVNGMDTETERRDWHRELVAFAERLFGDATGSGYLEAVDPERVVSAWDRLRRTLYGPKLGKVLALPRPAAGSDATHREDRPAVKAQ